MKSMILGLLFVGATAAYAQQPAVCYDGEKATISGVKMICRDGVFFEVSPKKYTCKSGDTAWFPVHGKTFGRGELQALATCVKGKWRFDNEDYNYKPTRGANDNAPASSRNGTPSGNDIEELIEFHGRGR